MPLVTVPKAQSEHSSVPSQTVQRSEVKINERSPSTSRVEALKAKLSGQTPSQPVAKRPAGSSARAEQLSKLTKYPSMPSNLAAGKTDARQITQDFSKIPLPPTSPEIRDNPNTIESPQAAPEATSEPMSPQFVALARKERQLRKAQQEFKAQQDAWKQEQERYIPRERLTSETLKVLSEAGITPDKLVELQLNQATSQDPNQITANKIAELEKKILELTDPENGELAKRDKAAYEQAITQIRNDVNLLVDSNSNFGTIKSEGRTEDVVNLITRVFDEEGTVLDVEEAAQLVEEKLTERLLKDYERLSKYEKIKAKFGKPTESEEANTEQQSPSQPKPTLTNQGSSTRPLTPRERAVLRVQEARSALRK